MGVFKGTGNLGELKVGYIHAATLGAWNLIADQKVLGKFEVRIDAKVEAVNGYWSLQRIRPFKVALWMGSSWWTWEVTELLSPIEVGEIVDLRVQGLPKAELGEQGHGQKSYPDS